LRLTSGKCLRQNIFQALNDLENFLHGNRRQVALQTGQWAFRDMVIFMCSDIFPSPRPRVEKFTRTLKAIIWSAIRLRSSLKPDLSYLLMSMPNYSCRLQQNNHSRLDQTGRDIRWSIHPTSYVSSVSTQSWERLLKLISPTTQAHQATLDTGMDVADDGVTRIEERTIVHADGEPSALATLMAMNAKLDHLLQRSTGGDSELPGPTSGSTPATITTVIDVAFTLTDYTDCTGYINYTDCTDCTYYTDYTDYTDCTDCTGYTVTYYTDLSDVVALFAPTPPAAIYDG
jgi:hypothetical protein